MADEPELALVERLTRKAQVLPAQGGGHIGTDKDGKTTSGSYITDDGKRLVNPDGPEAAAIIKELVKVLHDLAEDAADLNIATDGQAALKSQREAVLHSLYKAEAALTRAGANNDPSK